jgi:hypothetical protein
VDAQTAGGVDEGRANQDVQGDRGDDCSGSYTILDNILFETESRSVKRELAGFTLTREVSKNEIRGGKLAAAVFT